MCHLSHSYYSGACLYLTFGFKHDGVDRLAQYERVKNAIQQAFVDSGGTLSYHHAVGTEHAAWLEQDLCTSRSHDRRLHLDESGTELQPWQDHRQVNRFGHRIRRSDQLVIISVVLWKPREMVPS